MEEGLVEGSEGEESWEGNSTGLQDSWGGFPGENEAWDSPREEREASTGRSEAREGPREEREASTGRSEAWEGPREVKEGFTDVSGAWEGPQESQETRESSIAPVNSPQELQETQESPQEQDCSFCNRKKPLTDFGQFFTCNKSGNGIREQTRPGTLGIKLII
jgi:hypothetical protein